MQLHVADGVQDGDCVDHRLGVEGGRARLDEVPEVAEQPGDVLDRRAHRRVGRAPERRIGGQQDPGGRRLRGGGLGERR
ncbi:MAG: hypothetical protein ACSLFR_16455 [Solirubrobacteraceae bacterium]